MKIVKPESVDLNGERLKDLDKMFFNNYIGLNKLRRGLVNLTNTFIKKN